MNWNAPTREANSLDFIEDPNWEFQFGKVQLSISIDHNVLT